jgi:hypothetical protein
MLFLCLINYIPLYKDAWRNEGMTPPFLTSALDGRTNVFNVRFEVFTAVTMNNAVFWDVASCGSCLNRRSPETSVQTRSTWSHIPENGILQCFNVCLNSRRWFMLWLVYISCLELVLVWGLEYLYRIPASHRRRRNGNPLPGGITGPPCS